VLNLASDEEDLALCPIWEEFKLRRKAPRMRVAEVHLQALFLANRTRAQKRMHERSGGHVMSA
jgi:hypothetical protein